ncbi:MAG TPA: ClpXP protease specificity-enhancing factor SspB [Burkholderiales bacterium]
MTPLKLYLVRAVYDWAVENGFTPHIIVDAGAPGVRVPAGAAQDGRVVLNVSPRAVQGLVLDEQGFAFSARFGGQPFGVECALAAVRAIYARENGQGVAFPETEETPPGPEPERPPPAPRKGPVLKRIK